MDFLNILTEPQSLALLLSGATAILTCIILWQAFVEKDHLTPRLKNLEKRREEMKASALAVKKDGDKKKKKGLFSSLALKFAKVSKDKNEKDSRTMLNQAGLRGKDSVAIYNFWRAITPILLGGGTAAYMLLGSGSEGKPNPVMDIALIVGGFAAGFFVPTLYVKNLAKKRQIKLRRALPDALDLLVICAEAGLALDAALGRVTREIGNSSPELAEDLGLLSIELNFLNERRQAYENMIARTGLPELNALMNTLIQTEKYGTPLSQGLRVLSAEMRTERLAKAEEKAARLPAILTVPMIIFILPFLFIVIMGPAIMRIVDAFSGSGS